MTPAESYVLSSVYNLVFKGQMELAMSVMRLCERILLMARFIT